MPIIPFKCILFYLNGCFSQKCLGDGATAEAGPVVFGKFGVFSQPARVTGSWSGARRGNFCRYQWASALAQTRTPRGSKPGLNRGPQNHLTLPRPHVAVRRSVAERGLEWGHHSCRPGFCSVGFYRGAAGHGGCRALKTLGNAAAFISWDQQVEGPALNLKGPWLFAPVLTFPADDRWLFKAFPFFFTFTLIRATGFHLQSLGN